MARADAGKPYQPTPFSAPPVFSARGWSNYYHHHGHCTRVFGRQQVWLQNRVRRWLWRKYGSKHGLFSFITDARLPGQYQPWTLPSTSGRRR